MKGAFIVLEGIDGSGTTTQLELLASSLRQRGRVVHATREPSDGPVGKLLRELLVCAKSDPHMAWATMALLFAADRVDHVARDVRPALERGHVVLSDRYDLSSLIYQSLTAPRGVGATKWVQTLNRDAVRPDLTIVLDVAPEIAAARRQTRGESAELYETSELQRRLAEAYADAERFVPADQLVHVSGAPEPEIVAREVFAAACSCPALGLPAAETT